MQFEVIFIIYIYFSNVVGSQDKLIAVTAVVRHGERLGSYPGFYPNDPYLSLRDENPSDQLLKLGIRELYNVGLWMRKNYANFLSKKYLPNEIYVQSINFDRCLMSAESLLAALYPPVGNEIFNKKVLWQPIPVHSTRVTDDYVLQWNSCPYYNLGSSHAAQLFNNITEDNAALLSNLTEDTGSEVNLDNLLLLYNVIKGEEKVGLRQPDWTQGVIKEIEPLLEMSFVINTYSTNMKRLKAGPLLHRILTQFDGAISGGKNFGKENGIYRKFMLYSSADMPIYNVADSLDLAPNIGFVSYGFVFLVELRQKYDGEYYVVFLYRNSTKVDSETHQAHIRGFARKLDYKIFKKVAVPLSTNLIQWYDLCVHLLATKMRNNKGSD